MTKRAVILVPVLLLAACGSSPKTHFYTLVPERSGGEVAPIRARTGIPIQVGHVALPGTLDRLSLVTRGQGTDVKVSDQDRWAAPLDELMRRALTADLRDRLGMQLVLAAGDPPPPGGVRTLALNVQQFSGDGSGQVVLEADWTVGSPTPNNRTQSHHVTLRVAAGSASPDAITAAMSRATALLADAIAGQICC